MNKLSYLVIGARPQDVHSSAQVKIKDRRWNISDFPTSPPPHILCILIMRMQSVDLCWFCSRLAIDIRTSIQRGWKVTIAHKIRSTIITIITTWCFPAKEQTIWPWITETQSNGSRGEKKRSEQSHRRSPIHALGSSVHSYPHRPGGSTQHSQVFIQLTCLMDMWACSIKFSICWIVTIQIKRK